MTSWALCPCLSTPHSALSLATHCLSLSQPSPSSSPAAGTSFHGNGLFGQLCCSIKDSAWSSTQLWAASSQAGNLVMALHSNKPPENAAALAIPVLATKPSKLSEVGRSQMYQEPQPSIAYSSTKLRISGTSWHRVKCQMCHHTDSSPPPYKVSIINTHVLQRKE